MNDQISEVLKAILASPPSKADTTLSPAWVQVLGTAMISYHSTDSNAAGAELGQVWKTVWSFLESTDGPTKRAAAQSLDLLTRCITPAMIDSALLEKDARSTLGKIIAQATKALDSLAYAGAIPQVLSVISSLITNLRHKVGGTKSAAEALLLPLIKHVGDLRVQKGFEFKEDADTVLSAAMRALGPQVLLSALPLNLEPEDRYAIYTENWYQSLCVFQTRRTRTSGVSVAPTCSAPPIAVVTFCFILRTLERADVWATANSGIRRPPIAS